MHPSTSASIATPCTLTPCLRRQTFKGFNKTCPVPSVLDLIDMTPVQRSLLKRRLRQHRLLLHLKSVYLHRKGVFRALGEKRVRSIIALATQA